MPKNVCTKYPLHQSPFYKLQSKRRLIQLLKLSSADIKDLLSSKNNYNIFDLGGRQVEEPKPKLKFVHKRIYNLLSRVQTPEYLHSSVKKRSYVSNAKAHLVAVALRKIDLRKCYPSTKFAHILEFFKSNLLCSSDVATILTKIATFNNHLPTGSPLSPILCFYAHKKLFDKLYFLAQAENIVFTCYVDDLTFSGKQVSGKFMHMVRRLIARENMIGHKEKYLSRSRFMKVTGVGIKKGRLVLPNERQKKIYDLIGNLKEEKDKNTQQALSKSLLGRLSEAGQIEERFKYKKQYLDFRHFLACFLTVFIFSSSETLTALYSMRWILFMSLVSADIEKMIVSYNYTL